MKNIILYESYSDNSTIKLTSKQNRDITIKVQGGKITSIDNNAGLRFPYSVGQSINQGIKTWACNNGFKWNGDDTCPEGKVFGIKKKDIPAEHELRMMFPHKFR